MLLVLLFYKINLKERNEVNEKIDSITSSNHSAWYYKRF